MLCAAMTHVRGPSGGGPGSSPLLQWHGSVGRPEFCNEDGHRGRNCRHLELRGGSGNMGIDAIAGGVEAVHLGDDAGGDSSSDGARGGHGGVGEHEEESQIDPELEAKLLKLADEMEENFAAVGITDEVVRRELGITDPADEETELLAKLYPFHLPALYNLARQHHAAGRLDEARAGYERALACEARAEWADARAAALSNAGVIHHTHLANASYAEACYRAALDLKPDLVPASSNLAYLLLGGTKLSTRHTVSADPAAAAAMMRRVLELDPAHVPTLAHYGYLKQTVLGEMDEAEALYKKGLELDPGCKELLCNYAAFLCNVREPYDPETRMPVHFNATCNAEGAFDPRTTLPINPPVDRPCDRARALYNRALAGYFPPACPSGETDEIPLELRFPLMHGRFIPSVAPAAPADISAQDAASGLRAAEESVARAREVAARAAK